MVVRLSKSLTINAFVSVFIIIAIGLFWLRIFTGKIEFFGVSFLMVSIISVATLFTKGGGKRAALVVLITAIWILVGGVWHSHSPDRIYLLYLLYFLYSIMLLHVLHFNKADLIASKTLLYLTVFYLAIKVMTNGYDPNAYNEIISGGSRNMVSGYLLIFCWYYLFWAEVRGEKFNYLIIPLVVVLCFFLFGRSGLILSIATLFLVSVKLGNRYALVIIGIVLYSMLIKYYDEISDLLLMTNFASGLDTPRFEMNLEYLNAINSFERLFMGADFYSCCKLIASYDNNPHNSFVMMHARHGILAIIYFLISVVAVIFALRNGRFYLIILTALVCARYAFDNFGLFSPIDFIMMGMFWHLLYSGRMTDVQCRSLRAN